MRKINILAFIFILTLLLTPCPQTNPSNQKQTLTLPTTQPTLHFCKLLNQDPKNKPLTLHLKTFTPPLHLNQLTQHPQIHPNSFHHLPYLPTSNKTTNTQLLPHIPTIPPPLPIYSKTT
ncbi:MetQ/NlpA family ABC transporter substrate-binding protein, partial [Bacillus sp. WP8]|uniref:MetQ/NlpA family ABC transporter substrate-binding protein n=1 Tax=Bacillus sp. WP8 TaxID=756828 RepID=UPI001C92DEE9